MLISLMFYDEIQVVSRMKFIKELLPYDWYPLENIARKLAVKALMMFALNFPRNTRK